MLTQNRAHTISNLIQLQPSLDLLLTIQELPIQHNKIKLQFTFLQMNL